MKLYEIAKEYEEFTRLVESGEIPPEAIADTLESIEGEFDSKADNTACIIKNLEAEAAAIKAEESALKERRQSKEATADRLKNYLSEQMQAMGKSKLETARNMIGFRASTSVYIANEEEFKAKHPDLCVTETVVKIPKSEIGKALKDGAEIDGVELRKNQNLYVR